MRKEYLKFNREVADALASKKPLVALESTIISHGMPYPDNVNTARDLEQIVRDTGAIPATIAVIGGDICVGLEDAQLNLLAQSRQVMKLSRRDLAWCIHHKGHGATTVAATMIVAKMAGISLFATGGIGGVHRGAELNWDVSADLTELSRTDVAVVCAGPKAILDLPATLEYLETLGVPVVGYRCDELPAFYSRHSGIGLELRADRPDDLAGFIQTRKNLHVEGGVLVVNPIPVTHDIPYDEMALHIEQALADAADQGIRGKQLTPFLLQALLSITDGKSLEANIALVRNNVRLAAEVALALGA